MTLLVIVCDGETEQGFCAQLLRPYLTSCGFADVYASRIRKYSYGAIRRDVTETLKQHSWQPLVVSTMHDLYKLPKGFPESDSTKCNRSNPAAYVELLERAYKANIGDSRFIPYVQLYEFETLLFADPTAFGQVFEKADKAIAEMAKTAASFASIEHINDGESTSPSHRIESFFPRYNKRRNGVEIAQRIGLPKLREKCPHFDQWLTKLEASIGGSAD